MFLSLLLLFISKFYKNNSIIKIKHQIKTKGIGILINLIENTKKFKIKKLVFIENSKEIITFLEKKNIQKFKEIILTKTNEKFNNILIQKCNNNNINYSISNEIKQNLLNSLLFDFKMIFDYIIIPYLYFIIILAVLNVLNKFSGSLIINNEISNIVIKRTNTSKINNSSNYELVPKINSHKFFKPNVSLLNWVGSPEIFEECYEIISYQNNNSNYKRLGAVLPKGILLEGPPGVGKTYLAKAIASSTNSSFISVSGSEFIELYVGVGASRVRELFKLARINSPSIIFIDEIDALGSKRSIGGSSSHREHDQTLNQLLTEMDGFKDNSNILVMAATNRKDMLDPALLRTGRFDRHIHISLPDKSSREKILKLYLDEKKNKEKNINITTIAESTDGFSGADLKNLINEAAILAVRRGGQRIKFVDLTNAMEKLVVGLIKNNDDRSPETKYRVGIHEVGHAFLTIYFDKYFDLKKISIKSTYNGAGGYTLLNEKNEYSNSGLYTKDLLYKKIIILLGGKAAETIWYSEEQISIGATNDLKQANQLARKMIELFGMGSNNLETFYNTEGVHNSEKTKELIDNEIMNILSNAYGESKFILKKYKLICNEIIDKLITNEILFRNDLEIYYKLLFDN